MSAENNQMGRRKTLIPVLATIGTGLVVTAVVKLLGAAWPWLMLILGITLIVIAVFVSVPNTVQLFSPIHVYTKLRRACIWWFRGPQWSSSKPIISLDEVTPGSIGQTNYTATLSLTIKNRDDYTLEGALYSLAVNIEQGSGRRRVRCMLHPNPSYQIKIQQHDEETYPLVLFGRCYGTRKLDIEKPYNNWGIQGITVGLSGAGYKDLHRGLYIKPFRQEHIGII